MTLLPQTQVTTSTTPVPVEGGTCSGTSAGGALYDATQGDWKAVAGSEGVAILGIEGVDLPPFGVGNYAYWAIWLNNAFAPHGACEDELAPNEHVVFEGQCFALGPECATSASAPDHFLTMSPPTVSEVGIGQPVSVTVGSLSTESAASEPLPAGVIVSAGSLSTVPSAQGVATLEFPSPGQYTLQARATDSVPSDSYTVCVHAAGAGCGTGAGPSGSPSSHAAGGVLGFSSASYKGPFAIVAKMTDLIDGHDYSRRDAPRLIAGKVLAHTGVASVGLRLRRTYRGRCYAYDGARGRFGAARCGHGSYFSVPSQSSFSYLLPARLGPGRYVLDVRATDAAGNVTTLARGTSRIVFYVS